MREGEMRKQKADNRQLSEASTVDSRQQKREHTVEKRQEDDSTKQAVGGRQQTEGSSKNAEVHVDRRRQTAASSQQKANIKVMLRNL
jgi:hypothetical protein